jgi:hypothetical protein
MFVQLIIQFKVVNQLHILPQVLHGPSHGGHVGELSQEFLSPALKVVTREN